jgi:hypothetical protein
MTFHLHLSQKDKNHSPKINLLEGLFKFFVSQYKTPLKECISNDIDAPHRKHTKQEFSAEKCENLKVSIIRKQHHPKNYGPDDNNSNDVSG